jgi:hypothetical protein
MKKTQKKPWAWRSLYIWYRIMLIYINFKFNFLTKYHSFIWNSARVCITDTTPPLMLYLVHTNLRHWYLIYIIIFIESRKRDLAIHRFRQNPPHFKVRYATLLYSTERGTENTQWDIFRIFTSEDIDHVTICFWAWEYIINRTLHGGLKIWLLSFRVKNVFSPLEDKSHIFAPPCNILYILKINTRSTKSKAVYNRF